MCILEGGGACFTDLEWNSGSAGLRSFGVPVFPACWLESQAFLPPVGSGTTRGSDSDCVRHGYLLRLERLGAVVVVVYVLLT
jgi:hypothetical protein